MRPAKAFGIAVAVLLAVTGLAIAAYVLFLFIAMSQYGSNK